MSEFEDEIINGLRSGRTLVVTRKDSDALPFLLDLVDRGAATVGVFEIDEQSTVWKFRGKP